jgi:esterase/lipase
VAALLWAAPAQAFSKQTGTQTMKDGTSIAYDLYVPDGAAPAGGWPGVMALHGLGGTKDDMAPIAAVFVSHGYAVLAYSDRGSGTSTGNLELAGPNEISDEAAMLQFFEGEPQVSDTKVGAWGISYGGGQIWNGLVSGIRYTAAETVETWTDLYSALWPQNVAKSGIVLGFAKAVEARSPLIAAAESDAIHSTNLASIRALTTPRSSIGALHSVTTPVYMFQGRVDYEFDVTQAEYGYLRIGGPTAGTVETQAIRHIPTQVKQPFRRIERSMKAAAPRRASRSRPPRPASAAVERTAPSSSPQASRRR